MSNKIYIRIPGGEVQLGRLSRSVVVWFRGRKFTLKKAVSV